MLNNSTKKFRNFFNGDRWYGNFLGKFPESTEIVEFPKSHPFSRKFRKFRDESQMERKFPGKFLKHWVYLTRLSSFLEFMQISNVLATAKFVKKASYKINAPVVYLFVLHRLAGKCTKIYLTHAEPLYDSLNPLFCDIFAAVVVCARSLLLWSMKSHDVDLSVFCLLLYL